MHANGSCKDYPHETNCDQLYAISTKKKKIIHTQKQEHGDLANDIEIRQYKKLKKKL